METPASLAGQVGLITYRNVESVRAQREKERGREREGENEQARSNDVRPITINLTV